MVFYNSLVFIWFFLGTIGSSYLGGSGFWRGSSASVLMIVTILVMGSMMIFYVSFENMIEPAAKMIQVKIVVPNWSIAKNVVAVLLLTRA
jgi:hypothetical protein